LLLLINVAGRIIGETEFETFECRTRQCSRAMKKAKGIKELKPDRLRRAVVSGPEKIKRMKE
jgi:hypothetical protein